MVYKSKDHRKLPSIFFYNYVGKERVQLACFPRESSSLIGQRKKKRKNIMLTRNGLDSRLFTIFNFFSLKFEISFASCNFTGMSMTGMASLACAPLHR